MLKNIAFVIGAFTFGYLIASSNEANFKDNVENLLKNYENIKWKAKGFIYDTLENVENLDIDEIKMNIDRIFSITKERIDKLLDLDTFEQQLNYSKTQLKEVQLLSRDAFNKYIKKEKEK